LPFLLEEGVKKEVQGIQVIKTTTIGREREREKKRHPSWITSFSKLFNVEFQEVEKDNFQIKENMEK